MDGASLFNSPGEYFPGCTIYKLTAGARRCRNGYRKNKDGYELCKGLDELKDQSYMLWQIDKEFLKKTILPLGEMTKKEVRDIAKDYKLENANRDESMDLCFVVDNDYRQFSSS